MTLAVSAAAPALSVENFSAPKENAPQPLGLRRIGCRSGYDVGNQKIWWPSHHPPAANSAAAGS
ncbi:hypothetical protein DEE83_34355, partial [Burkholderia contaminans]